MEDWAVYRLGLEHGRVEGGWDPRWRLAFDHLEPRQAGGDFPEHSRRVLDGQWWQWG